MAQFDVFRLPNGQRVVDVQSDLLSLAQTRVVIPLARGVDYPEPIRRLNPRFELAGEAIVLVTQQVATIPGRLLARPIASLAAHDHEIKAALDMLISGF